VRHLVPALGQQGQQTFDKSFFFSWGHDTAQDFYFCTARRRLIKPAAEMRAQLRAGLLNKLTLAWRPPTRQLGAATVRIRALSSSPTPDFNTSVNVAEHRCATAGHTCAWCRWLQGAVHDWR